MALALARENINSVMEGPARARVEVDIFELQRDSQYETTDTSESNKTTTCTHTGTHIKRHSQFYFCNVKYFE